jgi:predicted Fe-Mo cluster-binding NifX family protein
MKKIALPFKEKKLSLHFENCSHFKFYYEENGTIIKEELISAPLQFPELIPDWLIEQGVTDVIAFGIGLKPIEILNRNKINVFVGVKVRDPKIIVQEYLDGILETDGNLYNH